MANKPTGEGGGRGVGLHLIRTGEKKGAPGEKSVYQERFDFITALSSSIIPEEQEAMRSDLSQVVFNNEDAKKARDVKHVSVTLGQLYERFYWRKRQENGNNPIIYNKVNKEEFRRFFEEFFDTRVETIVKNKDLSPLTEDSVGQPTVMDDIIKQQGELPEGPPAIPNPTITKGRRNILNFFRRKNE